MDVEVAAAPLVIALLLGLPAVVRAIRIARFHRRLGVNAWRFIVAADGHERQHG